MAIPNPNLSAPDMVRGGELSRPLQDLLRELRKSLLAASTPTDVAAIVARIEALEAASAHSGDDLLAAMYGTNGIEILGSIDSGVEIRGSASDGGPLAAQIFGG